MLEHSETMELIKRAQSGDQAAKQLLVEENSPLIKSVIKRYKNKGLEYDDLYQLGSMGFLKAINNFEPSFNVRFSTYCVPMIIGEIKRFLRDDGSIKVSRAIKSLNFQISQYIDEYIKTFQKKPTLSDISKKFNIDECEVVFTMESSKMPISIYTPLNDDEKSALLVDSMTQRLEECEEMLDNISLKSTLNGLETRDKQIILLRYFQDKTQSEIAKELNISQVQVSRLENKILEKLRQKLS